MIHLFAAVFRLALAVGAAFVTSPVMAQAVAPLAPAGKWDVHYDPAMCTGAREFASAEGKVIFALRPTGIGTDAIELVIIRAKGRTGSGEATVSWGADGQAIKANYVTGRAGAGGVYVTRATLPASESKSIATAHQADIRFDNTSFAFATGELSSVMRALTRCQTELAKSWGVDTGQQALVATDAVYQERLRLNPLSDYPVEALRKHETGISVVVYRVSAAGRIADCRVAVPSKSERLDRAACRVIELRTHYTAPAKDASGRPIESWATRRVVWSIAY